MKYLLMAIILFTLFSCSDNKEKKQELINNKEINTIVDSNNNSGDLNNNDNNNYDDTSDLNNNNTTKSNTNDDASDLYVDFEKIKKKIKSGDLKSAESDLLVLYDENKTNIPLLNMLGNIYNAQLKPKEAIKYLEEANKLSQGKDGHILLNLGISYSSINKNKAIKYLEEAKKLLPDDKNLDNILKGMQ